MTNRPPHNDLETVAEGDIVVIVSRHVSGKARYKYATVTRATPGAIYVDGNRYTRAGNRWGQPDKPPILPVTPNTRTCVEIGDKEAEFERLRWKLSCRMKTIEHRHSDDDLARLRAAVELLGHD